MPQLSKAIMAAEGDLGDDGRVIVRWSGTEPKLRVMVEGPDATQLEAMVSGMIEAAHDDLGSATP
jgi:phosphoglucosamine mutase